MNNENSTDLEYEKLKNSKFKQQKLPAWRPVPTITSTSLTFLFFGIAFIVIGIVVIKYSNDIVEADQEYDTQCQINTVCNVPFTIVQQMTAPVMIYYQLNNFYQNHRRYVKSKSSSQLAGSLLTVADLTSDCDPIVNMTDLGISTSYNGIVLEGTAPANPCGLIAKSFFNDTYALVAPNGTAIPINETGIAWEADIKLKYARPTDPNNLDPNYWQTVQWTDVMNEHFMVWMRPAGLPNFRKLWGRINEDLPAGQYVMQVTNNYDVTAFTGEKFFVLSTVNAFGGKNSFLGISYLVVGSICIILAIAFVIGYKIHNSKKEN